MGSSLEELLRHWLPGQRWYAGKGREIHELAVEQATTLAEGEPCMRHLVVTVDHGDREVDRYQVLLGLRSQLPERLGHALIGWCDGDGGTGATHWAAYDAVHDAELTRVVLDNIARQADVGGLAFRAVAGADLDTSATSLVLGGEQSNTSFVFGEESICKLFRRLEPGPNPDLELTMALTEAESPHVAPAYGWVEAPVAGVPTTLAMLQSYLRTASDGWALATTSVRDLYAEDALGTLGAHEVGGDFAAESERLGAATAAVHDDLARTLPTGVVPVESLAVLAESMHQQLEEARKIVPDLEPHAGSLARIFDDLARLDEPVRIQRVHGDFHLGQAARTDRGWVLLDFEGEPARPLVQRRALASPLRDVAGMLRSFDYAALYLLGGHPRQEHLTETAKEWAARNREAFCAGYARAGEVDPREHPTLLRAFEYDKAVYEVMYEARNRPNWLHIPLTSIARLSE